MGTTACILRTCVAIAFSAVLPPHSWAADAKTTAQELCFSCHGEGFRGGRTPPLASGRWSRAANDEDAARIIREGLLDLGMPAFGEKIAGAEATALVAFVHSLPPLTASERAAAQVNDNGVVRTKRANFRIEQFVGGLEVPWSMAFLAPDRMLVTERGGQLRVVDHGKLQAPIRGTPKVWRYQDGGLLSLALDPHYSENGWVYLSFSESGAGWVTGWGTSMTKIVRGRITDGAWLDQQVIWQADPRFYHRSNEHYGCRLLFIDGKLFFTIGERGKREAAQDVSDPRGKIHRIEADGKIPSDNPFVHQAGACPSVWSYGHRNPQGLAYNEATGELWETEHGPMGGDELNLIRPGLNYGWPLVTFGLEHSGAIISRFTSKPGMEDPITQWTPSIAVCPVHLCLSDRYPGWRSHLLVGSLARQEFRCLEVQAGHLVEDELLFKERGRIRDIVTGPDGLLYLAIEHQGEEGEILRLMPIGSNEVPR